MANSVTAFMRVYRLGTGRFEPGEAEGIVERWMAELDELGPDEGARHIPLVAHIAPDRSYLDLQGDELVGGSFEDNYDPAVYDVWGRMFLDDDAPDVLWRGRPGHAPRTFLSRSCRYGFDEVRVDATADWSPPVVPGATWERQDASWLLGVEGSYATGNGRSSPCVGPANKTFVPAGAPPADGNGLQTPTTPHMERGVELFDVRPVQLQTLGAQARPAPEVEQVELRWRGRVVHRARLGGRWGWEHFNADHWDNCVDPHFTPPPSTSQV